MSAPATREQILRASLLAELTNHGGNVADAAREMGKARMQIHRWCKRFGIDPNRLPQVGAGLQKTQISLFALVTASPFGPAEIWTPAAPVTGLNCEPFHL